MGIENPLHLLFIGVIALLVLGPRRLPELARALGHGIREFREAISQPEAPSLDLPLSAEPLAREQPADQSPSEPPPTPVPAPPPAHAPTPTPAPAHAPRTPPGASPPA